MAERCSVGARNLSTAESAQRLRRTALHILRAWGLDDSEQRRLLAISASELQRRRDATLGPMSHDQLERVSYIFGIWRALQILFPTQDRAVAWVRRPNDAFPFDGRSATDLMLRGQVADLAEARRYIDAEIS